MSLFGPVLVYRPDFRERRMSLIIRAECAADQAAIADLTEQAFRDHPYSQQTESFIIAALRRAGALSLSLVAEQGGEVVGHLAFSPAGFSGGSEDWYLIGPLSVRPDLQRQGLGSALMRAGMAQLQADGAQGFALVGEPDYYGRFGFVHQAGVSVEGVPDHFVLTLCLGDVHPQGEIEYHAAFRASSADG